MMIAYTTIVMTRFILTEWLRREENDQKTFGELFFICCDDIQDMDLITALQNLINFVLDWANEVKSVSVNMEKNQLQQWISRQAAFIKALFSNFCWES
jgi:hypothetical protein